MAFCLGAIARCLLETLETNGWKSQVVAILWTVSTQHSALPNNAPRCVVSSLGVAPSASKRTIRLAHLAGYCSGVVAAVADISVSESLGFCRGEANLDPLD